ncbi:MAG: hypothetical protein NTY61_01300, partial [Candidatus Parcubacteria bacterium]|nr:hypothetical protein [Candidatus Parcubacteria bacterium]
MDNNIMQTEIPKMPEFQPPVEQKAIKINLKIKWQTIVIVAVIIVAAVVVYYLGRGLIIAVTVNGSPISRAAIAQQLEKTYGKDVLDSMITEKLVNGAAHARGIVITDDVINA